MLNQLILQTKIGPIKITLTDKQIEQLIADGAQTLKRVEISGVLNPNMSMYIPETIGTQNVPGGFTGNKVDWTKYFPQITNDELNALIEDAVKTEKKYKQISNALMILLGVGLVMTMGASPTSALSSISIIKVIGSYFSNKEENNVATDQK